ncbi:MAG: CNNM domain-containing protein [Chthoniobacterales bacterium]
MIWLGLLACVVISFTFSGIEAGVLSVNRVRLRHNARRGEVAAVQLDALLGRIERLMITVVLVNNAANILGIALLYYYFTGLYGPWGAWLALAVALPVFVVMLEFLPRVIFRRFPYRTLVVFARILTIAHWICAPAVGVGAFFLKPFLDRYRENRDKRLVRLEDLRRITADSANRGQISTHAKDLVHSVVEFRHVNVSDIFTPFGEGTTVHPETSIPEILQRARETGTDRFPIINADGQCGGVVRVFDLLRDDVKTGRAQSYARRVLSFPLDMPAMEVLRKLRAARFSLGLVNDSHGVPVGLVSSESLVRRLLTGQK